MRQRIFQSTGLLILLALVLALSVPAATEVSATQPAETALATSAMHCPTAARQADTQIQSPLDQWTSETACDPPLATMLIGDDHQRSTQGAGLNSGTRQAEQRE